MNEKCSLIMALSSIGRSTAFHTEKLGSIPSWATTLDFGGMANTSDSGSEDWGFESLKSNKG